MAVAEVNQTCMSADPQQKKGEEVSLVLLPSMLSEPPQQQKDYFKYESENGHQVR